MVSILRLWQYVTISLAVSLKMFARVLDEMRTDEMQNVIRELRSQSNQIQSTGGVNP